MVGIDQQQLYIDYIIEKELRCNLAAVFRLLDLHGWTHGVGGQISARLNHDQGHFLVNPYGLLYNEITASNLVKVNTQGVVVDQGTTNFGIHLAEFQLHSAIYAARPDITCVIHIQTLPVTAVSSLKCGLLPVCDESIVIGDVSTHKFLGDSPIQKVTLLTNRGAFCCGETIEEAFFNCSNTVSACETQMALMPIGIENIHLVSEEDKKAIFEASRKSPASPINIVGNPSPLENRWEIGRIEFEALMRIIDNGGFRTGYNYSKPLLRNRHKEYKQQLLLTTSNVPKSTNPKEFKQLHQLIKDDQAGPQPRISEEISCHESGTLQDPTSSNSSPIKSKIESRLSVSPKTEKGSRYDELNEPRIEMQKLSEPSEPEKVLLGDDIVRTKEEEAIGEKLNAHVNAIARRQFFAEFHFTPIIKQTEKFSSLDELKALELENLIKHTIQELDEDSSNKVKNHESFISAKSVNIEEVDDDRLNDSLETIETSFQNDVNDSHAWRCSSPIINSMNVTPAKNNSLYELCKTENSLNYIPDSIQNQEEYLGDEIVAVKNNIIDLNEIIDLFDNSIDIEALSEPDSPINCDENEIVDLNDVKIISENSIKSQTSNESESLSDSAKNGKILAKDSVINSKNVDKYEHTNKFDTDEEVISAEGPTKNDIHELPHDKLQQNKNHRKGKKKSKQRVDNVGKDINTLKPEAGLKNPKSKKSKGKKKSKK